MQHGNDDTIAVTQLIPIYEDNTNTAIKQLVTLLQVKCKMMPFVHDDDDVDDDTIADVQTENDAIAIMQLVVLYQHAHDEARANNGGNGTLNLNVLVVLYEDVHENSNRRFHFVISNYFNYIQFQLELIENAHLKLYHLNTPSTETT